MAKISKSRAASYGRRIAMRLAKHGAKQLGNYAKQKVQQKVTQYFKKGKTQSGRGTTKKRGGDTTYFHDHDGIKMSKHVIVLKKGSKRRKVTQWVSMVQQNSDLVTGAAGAQSFTMLAIDFAQNQLSNPDSAPTNGPRPHEYILPLFNYGTQSYIHSIASGQFQTPYNGSGKALGEDMFIKSVDYDIMISNMSNGACVVDLYAVVSKKQQPTAGANYIGAWNSTQSGLYSEVAQMLLTGRGAYGTGVATKPVSAQPIQQVGPTNPVFGDFGLTQYGFTPFSLKGFNESYKCKFHKKLSMDGGSTHKFDIKMLVNTWVNEETVRNATAANYVIKGLTTQWFCIVRGQPGVVAQGGVVPIVYDRQVTPIATQLAVTMSRKINFGFGPGNSVKSTWLAPNFSILGTGATAAIVNVDDQEVNSFIVDPTDNI